MKRQYNAVYFEDIYRANKAIHFSHEYLGVVSV